MELFPPSGFGRGHPATGDEAFDRNHFCARAWNLGSGQRTAAYQFDGDERTIHTPWLSPTESSAFFDREVALTKQSVAAMRIKVTRHDADSGEVTSVAKHGSSVTLQMEHWERERSCQATDHVARIDPDGTVEYVVTCTGNSAKLSYRLSVTFPADRLPRETPIHRGDWIAFGGKKVKAGQKLDSWKGEALLDLSRGGQSVADWSRDFPQLVIPMN